MLDINIILLMLSSIGCVGMQALKPGMTISKLTTITLADMLECSIKNINSILGFSEQGN
jgi:hypothetical protein